MAFGGRELEVWRTKPSMFGVYVFGCMLGGSVEVRTRNFLSPCSLRVALILACQEVLNRVWPSMNRNNSLFT